MKWVHYATAIAAGVIAALAKVKFMSFASTLAQLTQVLCLPERWALQQA